MTEQINLTGQALQDIQCSGHCVHGTLSYALIS